MNISKNYMYLWCLSALFQSSVFAMRPGINIPTVPASWMAQGFSFGQPAKQPVQVAEINPELMRRVQEELRLEQPYVEQTQPVWSTQEMRPAYVVQQPRYTATLQMDVSQQGFQPEQKASLKRDTYQRFAGSGVQSGMFRSTAPHFMSRQQAASILGVSENPSPEELKSAYRKAALKAHPDAPGGSTKAMQDVNDAREILSKKLYTSPNDKGIYKAPNDKRIYKVFCDIFRDICLWLERNIDDEY